MVDASRDVSDGYERSVAMTREQLDNLKVGDEVSVYSYNRDGKLMWIPATVCNVYECTDGSRFSHGGIHSVYARVDGFFEALEPARTNKKGA